MDPMKSISRAFLASRYHHRTAAVGCGYHAVYYAAALTRSLPPVVTLHHDRLALGLSPTCTVATYLQLRHHFFTDSSTNPPPDGHYHMVTLHTLSYTPPGQSSPGFGTYPPVSAGADNIPPSPSSSSTQSAPQASTSVGKPQ